MAKANTSTSNYMFAFLAIGFLLLTIVICFIALRVSGWNDSVKEYSKTYVNASSCPVGKVCLNSDEYDKIMDKQRMHVQEERKNATRERDMRVLRDPLYPALNRTHAVVYEDVAEATKRRLINQPTSLGYERNDTYRLVGYMVNEEDPTCKQWKLFGRAKDRNRGEFYMSPVDNTIDLKVQITDDMMKGNSERLRSLDDIPQEVSLKTPLLSETPYKFIELPKGDFSDEYL